MFHIDEKTSAQIEARLSEKLAKAAHGIVNGASNVSSTPALDAFIPDTLTDMARGLFDFEMGANIPAPAPSPEYRAYCDTKEHIVHSAVSCALRNAKLS